MQVFDKVITFLAELLMQRCAIGFVEEFFDAGQCVGRTLVQFAGHCERCSEGLAWLAQAVDHAQLVQALGTYTVSQHQELGGQLAWDNARQTPSASAIG